MAERSNKLAAGWFDKATMAAVFGVAVTVFDRDYRPRAPAAAVRDFRGKLYFHARPIIDAWAAAKAAPADPLLAGDVDSPNLERYRAARADQEEMKRDQMRGTHADLKELDDALQRFANRLRGAGESLQRQYGDGATEIYNDAVNEASDQIIREFEALRAASLTPRGPETAPPPAPVRADKPKARRRRRQKRR